MRHSILGAARVVAVGALVAVVACDPCAGVVGCDTGPRISYSGRVVANGTGHAVAGATVGFARDSGVSLGGGESSAVTDGEGYYRIVADASEPGRVFGTMRIQAPGTDGYGVPGVALTTSEKRGAGGLLPTWLASPQVSFIGEFQDRRRGGYVRGGHARFVRTGGARLSQDTVLANIDETGRFYMFMPALDAGQVVGTLSVLNVLERNYSFEATIPVLAVDRPPDLEGVWNVGVSLYFNGVLRYRDGVRPVAGADVEFRQSGGLPLQPGHSTARTNQDGIFTFNLPTVDESPGEVVGDFVVRVPGSPSPVILTGIRVPTIDWEPPMSRPIGVFTVPLAPPSGTP